MKFISFLFLTLLGFASCQQLIDLKSFRNGNNKITDSIDNVGIYVSAHSDSNSLLQQIFVATPNQGQVSLYSLKSKKLQQNSGQLQPFAINRDSYVTTTLTNYQLNSLTGYMFVSTNNQLKDTHFIVVDVDVQQTIDLAGYGASAATLLFLNSNMATSPAQSTMFSNWKQDEKATVYMYRGIPSDSDEAKYTQIFSNPIHTMQFDTFFASVEKFSLSLGAFYMKTFASTKFTVEPNHYTVDGKTTSSYTTTGLYMKPIGERDPSVTLHTRRDAKYSGITGANTVGNLPTGAKVYVGEYLNDSHEETSFPVSNSIFFWQTPFVGNDFKISSTNGQLGEFYVQYFVIQGSLNGGSTILPGRQTTAKPGSPTLPPINPGNPTQGHYETTTKSSGPIQFLFTFMVVTIGYFH